MPNPSCQCYFFYFITAGRELAVGHLLLWNEQFIDQSNNLRNISPVPTARQTAASQHQPTGSVGHFVRRRQVNKTNNPIGSNQIEKEVFFIYIYIGRTRKGEAKDWWARIAIIEKRSRRVSTWICICHRRLLWSFPGMELTVSTAPQQATAIQTTFASALIISDALSPPMPADFTPPLASNCDAPLLNENKAALNYFS